MPKLSEHASVAGRYTLENVKPHLRGELNRQITALAEESAALVGSDYRAITNAALKRFSAWITPDPAPTASLPASPSFWTRLKEALTPNDPHPPKAPEQLASVTELADLSFEERKRLVTIHQGFRFNAILNEIIAVDNNAIALIWQSNCHNLNGSIRPEHAERNGRVYALRNSWAIARGLVKAGSAGYYDNPTAFGRQLNCLCSAQWLYNLRSLPADMLTEKGSAELQRVRELLLKAKSVN